jgi:N-glycosylase/DNA lyase
MNNTLISNNIIELDEALFDPDVTFDCGQSFRWDRQQDGSWSGVAFGRALTVSKQGGSILLKGANDEDYESIWKPYFDLNRNYAEIKKILSGDSVLDAALSFAPGIRILRQEPWEALCSFIISQNNNIPRIKGIVSRLCLTFGDKITEGLFAFPSAERIAGLSLDDLAPLRAGFRAGYILDAAQKVALGQIDFEELFEMPLDDARKQLQIIRGVGPKVADCALLFGCGRLDSFPIDVWIKRVLAKFYPDGFPQEYMIYGGIAQQFLFHYARCCPESGF